MLMGQKYSVQRDVILEAVRQECGVELHAIENENELNNGGCRLGSH